MKAYFVVLLIASSFLLNIVDIGSYEVQETTEIIAPDFAEEPHICGSETFSRGVRSAFVRDSDLEKYSSTQLYLTNQWVVVLEDPYCLDEFGEIADSSMTESYHAFKILSGTWIVKFQTGDLALTYLKKLHDSGYIWEFYPMVEKSLDVRYEPDDPFYASGDQWHLDNQGQNNGTPGIDLNTQVAWGDFTGDGIVIGVIDNGVDSNNPDISPNFLNQPSYDYCGYDNDVTPYASDTDNWHGTAVTGIVAGKGDNDIGIAGVAYNSSVVGLRIRGGDCVANYTLQNSTQSAFQHRLDLIDIYTNSWGPADDGQTLDGPDALALAAIEKGIAEGRDGLGSIYTWSNGNGLGNQDQSNKDGYANSRYTIAVGAVNWQGKQTSYSETGSNLLVSAPSSNQTNSPSDPSVFTTDISGSGGENSTDYTSKMVGTSASTPMVAGVVALMLEANQNLTWRDVQHILVKTSRKVDGGHPGWFQTKVGNDYNHAYGYGLVDATAAVNMAESWQTVDSEIVVSTGEITVDGLIYDNHEAGASSAVFVNQSMNIENVEVLVDVNHFSRGDLNLFLTSPNGVVSELVLENLDLGFHYQDWTFSSVVHWDENSFGEWTLKVIDSKSGGSSTGEFRSWDLTFYGTAEDDDDEDGLPNYAEYVIGTGPNNPDYDADGLLDGEEFYGWHDLNGVEHRTDPLDRDTDNDALTDWVEGLGDTGYVTDPNDNDTDDDLLLDGQEVNGYYGYFTNPNSQDTDNDTISDYNEINAQDLFGLPPSDPTKLDTDNDTMPDPYELANGFDPGNQMDGMSDWDNDGFDLIINGSTEHFYYTNSMEYRQETNPRAPDSDTDGIMDGWEYYHDLNPLVYDSDQDADNDTLSNLYEYENRFVERRIFSYTELSLRAHWKFDGNSLIILDESIINPGDTGVTMGNPVMDSSSAFNTGLNCDGVDDYVSLDPLLNSDFAEYTINSWVKLDAFPLNLTEWNDTYGDTVNYTDGFGTVFGTVTDGRTWLGVNSDKYFEFRALSGNSTGNMSYRTPITSHSDEAKLGIWYNLAATYSESQDTLKLYVNGTLVSEIEIMPDHVIETSTDVNYMCRGENEDEYLNGTIDNIALWDRALSSDEIRYVYERPLGFGNHNSLRIDDGIFSTNPASNDTDGDGLSDSEEVYFGMDGYLTDPTNPDTDGDGLNDSDELATYGTNPVSNDTDGDGYDDKYTYNTNLVTGLRLNQTGDAFPLNEMEWNDTDGDGAGDNITDAFPLDSNETSDSDGDGLADNFEHATGTSPYSNDTDGDGYDDKYTYDMNPVTGLRLYQTGDAFPLNEMEWNDTDGDGTGDNSDACPQNPKDSLDSDLDGYCDNGDAFPDNPNEWLDTDNDGYGDNSDEYPADPNRAVKPPSTEYVPSSSNYSLDTIMLAIVALGVTYFVAKRFMK